MWSSLTWIIHTITVCYDIYKARNLKCALKFQQFWFHFDHGLDLRIVCQVKMKYSDLSFAATHATDVLQTVHYFLIHGNCSKIFTYVYFSSLTS